MFNSINSSIRSSTEALQSTYAHSGMTVLLADDERVNRQLISALLRKWGHTVIESPNGILALDMLQKTRPDLVLLDLMMPQMDGYETTRRIRQMPHCQAMPIVVISALESVESIVTAIEAGADDYLIKPIRAPILAAKLRRMTEVLQIRKAHQEEEIRNRAIGDTVVDALVIANQDGLMEWINPAAVRMFGYPASNMLGQSVNMLMPESLRGPHNGFLHEVRQRLSGTRRYTQGLQANGKVFPVEITIAPLPLPGRVAYLGMVRDMTQWEQLERLKRDFMSVINHELRTPLTSVVGALSLLSAGAAGPLPPKAQHLVQMAERNTSRLGRLINDVLDLDKIESGALKLHPALHDAKTLLREAVDVNEASAKAKQIKLTLDLHAVQDVQPQLWVDNDRFQQIMSNLLSNAVKFSPPGSPIEVICTLQGQLLRVAVVDLGPGVSLEFQHRIFERFAQQDRPDVRKSEGSGLGLNIARSLARQMGGELDYHSVPGAGATFYLDLPVVQDQDLPQLRGKSA
jgi:PAS domain S-box-containing protein